MDIFNRLKKGQGGYIFVSHSHRDLEKVRKIRNRLEEAGLEPLCFYLKCLSDDSELEDLIKREIDAREWFLFVNSENSAASKWVTMEREYITRTEAKKILTVDLNDDAAVESVINRIIHGLRVFISCSHRDIELARRIKQKLIEKDFLPFIDMDDDPMYKKSYSYMQSWDVLLEASREGFVLALCSESWAFSNMTNEIEYARSKGGRIFPVALTKNHSFQAKYADETLRSLFRDLNKVFWLSSDPSDREIELMIMWISGKVMYDEW